MTHEEYVEFVDSAIEKAIAGESNLTKEVLGIRGFSSPTIRRLINNLTNRECTYLEVGVLMGGTFVSSFNEKCISIGFEDFTQSFHVDFPDYNKEELEKNIEDNRSIAREVKMYYECGLDADKSKLPNNIDIYLFDGEHGLQNHSVALPEFFDNMADRFLYIVDDTEWAEVSQGTGVGFKFLRNKMWIEKVWELRNKGKKDKKWVCGINIYLVKKKK